MKAMIFAAGLGTRFKPWTDHHPKALAMVNRKTLLQRNVEWLKKFNIHEIVVNVHHFPDQIIEIIQKNKGWGAKISVSDESDNLLETGGGLKKAKWFFDDGAFVVINADILTDLDLHSMIRDHQKKNPLATLAISNRESSRYFLFDEQLQLKGWRNTRTGEEKIAAPSSTLIQKAFSGIHIIEPRIFNLIKQKGKFSIVDVYLDLASTEIIGGFDHTGSKLVDVGRPESLLEAEKLFRDL
ncbi:MAG TPA: nucleotidyltransferase family protein [Puia sp.]|nr:nucleotidyltransferase family protein [Puia sp.]